MSRNAAGFAKYNYKTKVNTFNMVPTARLFHLNSEQTDNH